MEKPTRKKIKEKSQAVILLGHGSRVPGAGDCMYKVAERLKQKYGRAIVEVCFLSWLPPYFEETFNKCVANGADRVVVIPYFLHLGLHLKLDIPELLIGAAAKHPEVELLLGGNLGYDHNLADIVEKRIKNSTDNPNITELVLPSKEAFPVPVGQCEFLAVPPEMVPGIKAQMKQRQKREIERDDK